MINMSNIRINIDMKSPHINLLVFAYNKVMNKVTIRNQYNKITHLAQYAIYTMEYWRKYPTVKPQTKHKALAISSIDKFLSQNRHRI